MNLKRYLYCIDFLLHVLHISLIVFYLLGWLFASTAFLHLILSGLILVSWVGGAFFSHFGCCLITEWHKKVKELLNEEPMEYYVKCVLDKITGRNFDGEKVDKVTITLFFGILILSTSLFFSRVFLIN